MDSVKNESDREPYEAPTIEDMPVRPEEQLLAACKVSNFQPSPGSGGSSCFACMNTLGS